MQSLERLSVNAKTQAVSMQQWEASPEQQKHVNNNKYGSFKISLAV
jgi:hypothetical protein